MTKWIVILNNELFIEENVKYNSTYMKYEEIILLCKNCNSYLLTHIMYFAKIEYFFLRKFNTF